ncbi:MAG: DUF1015 domain-containing protein [Bacteroidetes bacterium]|nr:DUF1015 domain-containing protein [Bacteroidota bacterium]MBS1940616.1 DUF1015 domain-containing protein [Bacteroidota bacterium]
MIHVRPFRAWRPAPHTASLVGSRSFLNYSEEQLREKLRGNPYSFLHIIHADHDRAGMSRTEHFDAVHRKFLEFVDKGFLVREAARAFYIYEQSSPGFISRGLIGAVDVADYREGRIKVHEQTLTAREELFKEYLDHTGINAEPVLLAVPRSKAFEVGLDAITMHPTLFDFCTTDQVRHRFWRVDHPDELGRFAACFRDMEAMYIADGHHRCASSARLAEQCAAAPGSPKSAFLAYMVPEGQLHIFNFDRTVKGLNGLDETSFLDRLRASGRLWPLPDGPGIPEKGTVELYTRSGWHGFEFPDQSTDQPAEQLDAARLSSSVLTPVLGIADLRTDQRVRFVPGTQGTDALEHSVDNGLADVAFHLQAVSFAELRTVADHHVSMPPKSTWIEPKLRSGLTIYSLDDH